MGAGVRTAGPCPAAMAEKHSASCPSLQTLEEWHARAMSGQALARCQTATETFGTSDTLLSDTLLSGGGINAVCINLYLTCGG